MCDVHSTIFKTKLFSDFYIQVHHGGQHMLTGEECEAVFCAAS